MKTWGNAGEGAETWGEKQQPEGRQGVPCDRIRAAAARVGGGVLKIGTRTGTKAACPTSTCPLSVRDPFACRHPSHNSRREWAGGRVWPLSLSLWVPWTRGAVDPTEFL